MTAVDVVVIGAGPAGLAVALNLVRARRRVVLLDSNRPRHAVSLMSHGFITRDGTTPLEFRRLGREEVEGYEEATVLTATVTGVERDGDGLIVHASERGGVDHSFAATHVVLATGLVESFPEIPSLRQFYGSSAHSCMECDGYGYKDKRLALIGETDDVAERAILLSQWTSDVVLLTNGADVVSDWWKEKLAERGISVDDRHIAEIEGGAGGILTGVRFADGSVLERDGVFVRPHWTPSLNFVDSLDIIRSSDGLIAVDNEGRTSETGLWAVGDITPPGPEQLLIAAGAGQRMAAVINRTMLGLL
jgi:thioredoxin reductase